MAGGRIKGITIEIGGDTVGLQNALQDVNKRSNDLTKELKDVERLLKFNPGNVEALAQKQQLLTQRVEATTEKLNQLKAAEQQVQAQFERGDIGEEQYRAFRREIEYTEGSLGGLQNQLKGMRDEQERAARATQELNAIFNATGTSVDQFESALGSRLTAAIRQGTATSAQLEEAMKKLQNELKETTEEQDRVEKSTRELNVLFDASGRSVDEFSNILGSELTAAIKNGTASSEQLGKAIDLIGRRALGSDADLERFRATLRSVHDGADLDQISRELDDITREARNAEKAVDGFGIELENVAGALVAGGGIATAIEQALDVSNLNTKIEISMEVPEASKQSVKAAIRGVETYGVDAEAALEGVRRQWTLNKNVSDEANAAVVKGAAAITAAYGDIDFTELIQETNEIANELGITNDNALGLVNALLKIGFPPEQLDIIAEYGGQLTRAGYSAEEVQAIMAAGVETGTWNIDNLLDGLKEGRIKAAEFGQGVDKAMKEALEGTKISAEQLEKWGQSVAKGGKEGSAAMTDIAKALNEIEDETKRNEIGVKLFGTMYEDQGQNIIDTLLNAQDKVVDFKNNQDQLNESVKKLDQSPAVKMQQAMVELKTAFEPLLLVIADVISAIATWAAENPKLASTIAAISIAMGIVIGAIAALAPGFVALSGAIAGAGGAAAVFGGALAVLTGPVGLAIAAIAGLTAGGIALYNHFKQSSIEVGLFGSKVSESTEKAVGGFLKLNDQATVALNQLAWSGQTVTGEMANGIVNTFSQMGDQVLTAMQEDHAAQLATIQTFFDSSAAITDEEEAEIIAKMQTNQQQQQDVITNGKARIAEILNAAKEEKRAITDAERQEINSIQEQMTQKAVEHMSTNEREQKVILERLKTEATEITAKQAAEVVKNSVKQKDDVVKEANDQYNKTIAEIIKQRDEAGTITADQAKKLIEEAERQKNETVKKAEDMHQKVVSEAQKQANEHVDKVNWETGEVLSKWEIFKKDFGKAMDIIGTIASNKWEQMKKDTENKWEEIKKWPGKKIDEMKRDAENKMNEVKSTIDRILKDITGFFKNLSWSFPEIKMPKLPRFSFSGEFSLNPPSVPKLNVDWYDKGGVFYGPQVIGVGEKRPEFVGALEDLEAIVRKAMLDVSSQNVGVSSVDISPASQTTTIENNYNMTFNSPKALDPYETSRLNRNALRELALQV
ncbi:phage tail tape measure protein [Bacillus sp. NPDC094106]|uniref:phage tail tape measure protein n=1 Tax=Bacillus sp. NPDC094106 TaxID=3363949 RepID=UPI0037F91AE6